MSETRLGQSRTVSSAHLLIDCNRTPTIKFIVPCLQKQWHLIIKGLHPSGNSVPLPGSWVPTWKALPGGRSSLRELCLRSLSYLYQVMAGGFYPPICKSTRRFGGRAGGWLILGQAVVTLRLPCAIVESPRLHKHVPFVNIAFLHSRSIKRRQWKHKLNYYGVVFAHLATGCGIKAKDPSGLDSDRWIPHSRCCKNPARAKALAGFSQHLSAGFTDLNPAPRGLSLYKAWTEIGCHFGDDILECISLNEIHFILIKISLRFVPEGPTHDLSVFF